MTQDKHQPDDQWTAAAQAKILAQYRQASIETPSATLDECIFSLAENQRLVTAPDNRVPINHVSVTLPVTSKSVKSTALSPFSGKWVVPLSLAATLTITIGLVSFIQREAADDIAWNKSLTIKTQDSIAVSPKVSSSMPASVVAKKSASLKKTKPVFAAESETAILRNDDVLVDKNVSVDNPLDCRAAVQMLPIDQYWRQVVEKNIKHQQQSETRLCFQLLDDRWSVIYFITQQQYTDQHKKEQAYIAMIEQAIIKLAKTQNPAKSISLLQQLTNQHFIDKTAWTQWWQQNKSSAQLDNQGQFIQSQHSISP